MFLSMLIRVYVCVYVCKNIPILPFHDKQLIITMLATMKIGICICIYLCLYVYMYLKICVCVYAYIYVYMYVNIYIHTLYYKAAHYVHIGNC
jgi:hypothetical protein